MTLWTTAHHQALLSLGFPKQEYWSGLSCPLPGDLLDPGIELMSITPLALVGGFYTTSATREAYMCICICTYVYVYIYIYTHTHTYTFEKEMAPHSSILSWKIPWTEESGGPQSVHGVPECWTQLSETHTQTHTQTHTESDT